MATSAPTPMTVPEHGQGRRATGRASRPASDSETRSRRVHPGARDLGARLRPPRATAGPPARSRRDLLGEPPVDDPHAPVRVRGDVVLVRDGDDRQPGVAQLVEEREDRVGVGRVEVARRLVAEQQAWGCPAAPGPRRRAAARRRRGAWAGTTPGGSSPPGRGRRAPAPARPSRGRAAVDLGQHHVLDHGPVREEVEALEDEADPLGRAGRRARRRRARRRRCRPGGTSRWSGGPGSRGGSAASTCRSPTARGSRATSRAGA